MKEHIPLKDGRTLFGRDTNAYQQGRPDYPLPIFALLKEHCGPEICRMAFEIGPGTGQATEHLLDMGYQVRAIEPDHNLAIKLKERLGRYSQDSFSVINSTFEDAPLEPGCFDLGIAATSFHWIEPVSGLERIFQLLRPGGWFAMWWTVFGDPHNVDAFMQKTEHLFPPLAPVLQTRQVTDTLTHYKKEKGLMIWQKPGLPSLEVMNIDGNRKWMPRRPDN
ncbi:TPA: class I SAM-dependent methyltransferase [Salmonella enterica subsp. houtenae]|nr:class I SAM-dependent methyltransferase [Salmonella enterica subsp. houtenae]